MSVLLQDSENIPKFAPMKQKKKELMMQEYGKYFLDMSKLVFDGIHLVFDKYRTYRNVVLSGCHVVRPQAQL